MNLGVDLEKQDNVEPIKVASEEAKTYVPRSDCFAAATFFIIGMLFNCLTLNYTHFRMPDPYVTAPLRDVGFEFIPLMRLQWLPDSMLGFYNIMIILAYLNVIYIDENLQRSRRMWVRYFTTWGICVYMRAVSIFLTSLPPTDNHCQNPKKIDNIWVNTIMGFITVGSASIHCGDLMFSGHTVNIVNATLHLIYYCRKPVVPIAASILAAVSLFLIIASRSHYSIDVFIATCLSVLTFYAVPEKTPVWLNGLSAMWSRVNDDPTRQLPRSPAS